MRVFRQRLIMQRCIQDCSIQRNNIKMYKLCSCNCKEHQEKTICQHFSAAWKEVVVLAKLNVWVGSIDDAADPIEACSSVLEL